ncbi:hypothetical protein CCACVL1_14335 [Corchorus capsularis]|uniref:Uncharacterized protein n=1 Tax=Corchorus capsularis TaxID=210143 RepID=A0A1R3I7H7_COCAP|nr:hypothetical protein CCACVL1_14335 [Corchorus capsularis]
MGAKEERETRLGFPPCGPWIETNRRQMRDE